MLMQQFQQQYQLQAVKPNFMTTRVFYIVVFTRGKIMEKLNKMENLKSKFNMPILAIRGFFSLIFSLMALPAYAEAVHFLDVGWDVSPEESQKILEESGLDCAGPGEALGSHYNGDARILEENQYGCIFPDSPSDIVYSRRPDAIYFDDSIFNGGDILTEDIVNRLDETTGLNLRRGADTPDFYDNQVYGRNKWCADGDEGDMICVLAFRVAGLTNDRGGDIKIYKNRYGMEEQKLGF